MFLVVWLKNNKYGVLDTSDNVVESYSYDELATIVKGGIQIGGTCFMNGVFKVFCHSDSVMSDFLAEAIGLLAKYKLVGINDKKVISDKIFAIAVKYGFCTNLDDMIIDTDKKTVIFRKLNIVVPFKTSDDYQVTDMMDVCDPTVTSLSKMGVAALNYIKLTVGGIDYPLTRLLDLLYYIDDSFNIDYVTYIGITPSNKMFKIVSDLYCYSVKFDTFKALKEQQNKILCTKTKKSEGFVNYVKDLLRHNKSDNTLVVTKITIKGNVYAGRFSYERLKETYPTLHDVYVTF